MSGDGKTSVRGGYGIALRAELRQRDLQRALQPAGVPGGLDRRPGRRARRCRSTSTTRAVRRRRRRDQADPGRQPAARRPEHRDRLQPLLQPVASSARSSRTPWPRSSTRAPRAASCTTSPTPTSAARRSCTSASAPGPSARPRSTRAFNTRGNRGQSQYHGVTFALESAARGQHGPAVHGEYTSARPRTT